MDPQHDGETTVQSPPPGSIKVSVINAPADQPESTLRDWMQQNKARIMGTSQSSASHNGQLLITMVIWHQYPAPTHAQTLQARTPAGELSQSTPGIHGRTPAGERGGWTPPPT